MEEVVIYHNPRCVTSRAALKLLDTKRIEHRVVEYLKTKPDRATLTGLLRMLSEPPAALVRNDKRFKELGLKREDYREREAVVTLLLAHPELMQRPVVVRGQRAVIARPPQRLLELVN